MELSPKAITSVEFHLVRKGYDPDEVRAFLASLAKGVEAMQTQLANADARARAAVQRMQEVSSQGGGAATAAAPVAVAAAAPSAPAAAPVAAATVEPDHGQAETIARTLVLAQRTADATVADAQDRARTIVASAEERGRSVVDEAEGRASQIVRAAEERSAQMIEKAKADAVQAQAGERARVEAEVNALTSQRSELHHTIELLGGHVLDQRARLSGAADALRNVLESPAGLRHVAPPVPNPAVDSLSSSGSTSSSGSSASSASSGSSASASGFGTSSVAPTVGDAVGSAGANVPPPPTSPAAASDAAHVLATETANLSGHSSAEAATLPGIAETTDEVPAFNDVRWAPETEEA